MAFPRDFPSGFVLYQTKNREDNSTVSMRYVNRIGLQAARDGKPMPSGSVIILANHAAQRDRENKPVVGKDGTWQPDKIINGYAGMEARAGWSTDVPKLLLNEPVPGVNWNYAEFTADKKPRPESNQAVCLACHRPVAKTSFVYGYSRIKAAATAK